MKELIYILEVSIIIGLFTMLYGFLFRKNTNYLFNRFLLLFVLFISFIIPMRLFEFSSQRFNSTFNYTLNTINFETDISPKSTEFSVDWIQIIKLFYFVGLVFFTLKFLYNLFKINRLYKTGIIEKHKKYTIINTNVEIPAFSFLKYIFINKKDYQNIEIQEIITHEIEHIKQKHSIDILISEIIQIILWFNPLIVVYKKYLLENHEYFVDYKIVNSKSNPSVYLGLLLKQTVYGKMLLGNQFNNSRLYNRLNMLKKTTDKKISLLKIIVFVPILFLLIIAFSKPENKQNINYNIGNYSKIYKNQTDTIYNEVDEMPVFPGGNENLMTYISENLKYPQEAKEKGISGKVFVSFEICEDGKVANPKVVRGVNNMIDNEAIRVISCVPNFIPGYKNGKPVKVSYTIPISFILK